MSNPTNQSFAFYGCAMTPEERAKFQAAGCREHDTVAATTNFVVLASPEHALCGVERARALKIPILSLQQFRDLWT